MPRAIWPASVTTTERPDTFITWTPLAHGHFADRRLAYFFDWGPLADERATEMADHQVVDWAIDRLANPGDRPLFLAVGLFRPHIPWYAPQRFFDMYPIEQIALPEVVEGDLEDCSRIGRGFCRRQWHQAMLDHDLWRSAVQSYLAATSFADYQVGRILDALDNSPQANNTIVILWSDHGMHIGEKEHWEKFTLWEESTRVPLMLVAPGVTQQGQRITAPASLLDVYPTLIDLCRLPERDDLDGESLLPIVRGEAARRRTPVITTWGAGNHTIRSERYRYIHYRNGDEELYDHANDPNEFHNRADDDALRSVIEEHRQAMASQLDIAPLSRRGPAGDEK